MRPKHFLANLDETKIVEAIAQAEQKSSGEIRLYISHQKREEVYPAAQARFLKLGMTRTRQRNAVLLYFAPLAHKFAIVGDTAVHEKCGQEFWERIIEQMSPALKAGHYTKAVVEAIERVGGVLARHFPRSPDDKNELPDAIVQG